MEKNSIEAYYNQLYTEIEHAYGGKAGEPDKLVAKLPEYLQNGFILELGAGEGRNGLWLARHGFQVEARDISSVGVEKINKIAMGEKLSIRAIKADVQEPLQEMYDAIVAILILHHLTREKALKVIEQMKNHTRPFGYNLVTAITKEGDFFKRELTTNKFFPAIGEMKKIYGNWEVLNYQEVNRKARLKKENGSPMLNVTVKILARKSSV